MSYSPVYCKKNYIAKSVVLQLSEYQNPWLLQLYMWSSQTSDTKPYGGFCWFWLCVCVSMSPPQKTLQYIFGMQQNSLKLSSH